MEHARSLEQLDFIGDSRKKRIFLSQEKKGFFILFYFFIMSE